MTEKKKAPGIHDVDFWVNKDSDYKGEDKPVKLNPEWVARVCTSGVFDPSRPIFPHENVCRYLKPDPEQKTWRTKKFQRERPHLAPAICVRNCVALKQTEDQRVKKEKDKEDKEGLGGSLSRVPAGGINCSGSPDFKIADSDEEKLQPDYARQSTKARGVKPTR